MSPAGFVASSATRYHPDIRLGQHIFIAEKVVLFSPDGSGRIDLGNRVHVYQDTFLETAEGGEIHIGSDTGIHARCQLMAYKGSIRIGCGVAIAHGCGLYPSDHGIELGRPIRSQPLTTKGSIEIGDEAWLGAGVMVLSGVRIGSGAVIAAGSVVMRDVPDNAIAAGVPARVIGARQEEAGDHHPAPLQATH
jgi:acetyltransferase-like isoleucine patch superfamily enzyme